MQEFNRQAVFNKVWNHFVVNGGQPGYDFEAKRCVYGAPGDANRCAIGIFDDTGILTGSYLGVGGIGQENLCTIFGESLPKQDILFLKLLQESHDESTLPIGSFTFSDKIMEKLTMFALQYSLEVPTNEHV